MGTKNDTFYPLQEVHAVGVQYSCRMEGLNGMIRYEICLKLYQYIVLSLIMHINEQNLYFFLNLVKGINLKDLHVNLVTALVILLYVLSGHDYKHQIVSWLSAHLRFNSELTLST